MSNKLKTVWIAAVSLALLSLNGCGGENTASAGTPEPQYTAAAPTEAVTAPPEEETEPDYGPLFYTSGDCSFGIMDEAGWVLNALGEPFDTFSAESCAYQGSDDFYYYDGIEVCVNEIDGVQRITSISLTDDTVQTPQGVRIGMEIGQALGLMSMEYTESGGIYSFTSGSTVLRFQTDGDGSITAIQYAAS